LKQSVVGQGGAVSQSSFVCCSLPLYLRLLASDRHHAALNYVYHTTHNAQSSGHDWKIRLCNEIICI